VLLVKLELDDSKYGLSRSVPDNHALNTTHSDVIAGQPWVSLHQAGPMIWSPICMEKVDVVVNLDPVAAVSCRTSDLDAPTCLMHTNS
jgi:hypothetical protein